MNGILVIDKPAGVTSFDMVRQARRWCNSRRVGHAGTLDPMATGVLPIAVGWSTRLIEYFMAGEKIYQATMKLGAVTDTQDAEGSILEEKDWHAVDRAALDAVVARFVGRIEQLPPMYSALKKDGKPLYQLARQGIEVERQPRPVQIDSLVIDDCQLPYVTFTVQCSKGTYVRTLCHDIGQQLGCGAHMTALRRLACGQFDLSMSHTPESLQLMAEQGCLPLLSPAAALADWTPVMVEGPVLSRLQDGVAPRIDELETAEMAADEKIKFLAGESLVAIARYVPGGLQKRPGDFELLKVFPLAKDR